MGDYSITALRAAFVTVGALIVAKSILVVEALPIARLFSKRLVYQVLWKTLLFSAVALLFRLIEEFILLLSKHGSLMMAIPAMYREAVWPQFWVLSLWLFGGLFFYSLTSELVHIVGTDKVKEMLFGTEGTASER